MSNHAYFGEIVRGLAQADWWTSILTEYNQGGGGGEAEPRL